MKREKNLRQLFFCLSIATLSLTSMGCETLKSACGGHCGAPKAPDCGNGSTTLFSEFPVDLNALNVVEPLGHVAPPGHTFPSDHLYLILHKNEDGSIPEVPVTIPAKINVLRISEKKYYDIETDELTQTDYSIDFDPCEDYSTYFLHVNSISADILAMEKKQEENSSYDTWDAHIEVKSWEIHESFAAGTPLGAINNPWATFDWGAFDRRDSSQIPEELLSPGLEQHFEDYRYTVCPIHELPEEIQAQIVYGVESQVMAQPDCGTIFQNKPGTLKGVWFKANMFDVEEEPHIAFLHYNVNPAEQMVSIGNTLAPITPSATTFVPQSTGHINRHFEEITPGETVYCYPLVEWSDATKLLVQMPSEKEILAQGFTSGECDENEEIDPEKAVSFIRL